MSEPQDREAQLAYSESMAKMLDEQARRKKAAKIVAVVRHALGVPSLAVLRAVDVGCSAGFIADELALLQDRVPPFPGDESVRLIEQALGGKLETWFSEFSRDLPSV